MEENPLIKNFDNFEAKIENGSRTEKKLFEERKQLFNFYQKPKLSGGGLNRSTKNLINKEPNSLTSEVQRLIAKRFQNTQEWIKEQKQKENAEQEEVKKLISEAWNKETS